jgi:multidrug resistance efflux pump
MVETALNRLNDEIAAVGPRVAELNRALDQQKLTAGHTLARIETERRRAAQTTAAQFDTLLDTLRRAVESARADLDFIKNGIETWLLPTMARHEAELRRRGGWLGKLRRSAGWIRPTPPD